MLQPDYLNASIIAALQKEGITKEKFSRQDISYNIEDLVENKTDAYAIYATNQLYKLDVKMVPYRVLGLQEQGVEFYGDIVITSKNEVKDHSERVKSFMEATSLGWQYAFEHTNDTIDLILEKYNTQNLTRKHLIFEARTSAKYILPDVVSPGYMNIFRWKQIAKVYSDQGFLPIDYPIDNFVYLPQQSIAAFVDEHLWQILVLIMALLVLFFAVSALALQRLVHRKTAELEVSERSAEKLLDVLDVGIVVHKNGYPLYANPYAINCFQVDESDSIYKKNVFKFVHPEDRHAAEQRLLDLDGGYARTPVRYVGEQGRLIDAEVDSMSFVFHGEEAILTIIHDVTERNLRLMADVKVQKQMEQAQRLESMGVMAGGIAHDFNNLLAVILGHADMALYATKRNPDALKKSLECIVKASESAASLCQQMLAFSGKGKFIIEPIQLSETVHGMLDLIEVTIGKDTQVTCSFDDVSMVKGDESQLQQVVMNLLINASEAIEHQSGKINLHIFEVDVDKDYLEKCHHDQAGIGSYVCLEVSDNGCGISDKVKDKIFEPFYTTKFAGRGLGMSAILGITIGHQGMINIGSALEQGTVIRVLIPCHDADDVVSVGSDLSVESTVHGFTATVLLVDDEEQVLLMARKMLESLGLKVITACNGKEAVQAYAEKMSRIDFIMLDLTMPVMNGNDAYIALQAINPKVKVVICSGYTEEEVKNEFGQLKQLGFVSKPYLVSTVRAAISKLLV